MATSVQPPAERKAELRREIRRRRRARNADELAAASRSLAALASSWEPLRSARVVAAYGSTAFEPPTWDLLDALVEGGARVLLPVLLPDRDLDWAAYDGRGSMVPAGLGLLEPSAPGLGVEAVREAGVVLVPALAVSESGDRLGQGGGSYDRVLARLTDGTAAVALVFDDEFGLAIPTEPHDRRVTHVCTPSGHDAGRVRPLPAGVL